MRKCVKISAFLLSASIVLSGCAYQLNESNLSNNAGENPLRGGQIESTYRKQDEGATRLNNRTNLVDDRAGTFNARDVGRAETRSFNGPWTFGNDPAVQSYGISSALEARLNQHFPGSKVLIIGDTVIVGLDQGRTNYFAKQQNGAGNQGDNGNRAIGNRQEISDLVRTTMGLTANVLIVTDQNTLRSIDRLKGSLQANPASPSVSADLEQILKAAVTGGTAS